MIKIKNKFSIFQSVEGPMPLTSSVVSNLRHNYRSLPSIIDYYNKQFYNSELIPMLDSKESYEAKLLRHLGGIFDEKHFDKDYGIHFMNVAKGHNRKWKTSWCNQEEVIVVSHSLINRFVIASIFKRKENAKRKYLFYIQMRQLVEKLTMTMGVNKKDIGIIAPYSMQVRMLEKAFVNYDDIRIGTVEEFQGLEKKIILISTVRTCESGTLIDASRQLGFVKCPKRINVAISRAQ